MLRARKNESLRTGDCHPPIFIRSSSRGLRCVWRPRLRARSRLRAHSNGILLLYFGLWVGGCCLFPTVCCLFAGRSLWPKWDPTDPKNWPKGYTPRCSGVPTKDPLLPGGTPSSLGASPVSITLTTPLISRAPATSPSVALFEFTPPQSQPASSPASLAAFTAPAPTHKEIEMNTQYAPAVLMDSSAMPMADPQQGPALAHAFSSPPVCPNVAWFLLV